jgi:hypothetical protein
MKLFIGRIWQDVEPDTETRGPFDTEEQRVAAVRQWLQESEPQDDYSFIRINIDIDGIPTLDSFTGYEVDRDTEVSKP